MTCPKLENHRLNTVDFHRFDQLHPEGKKLISSWFQRAWNARDNPVEDVFEPFIFAWFAFNGWASCVADEDIDRKYVNALATDQRMNADFKVAVENPTSLASVNARELASFLPIFDVKTLRKKSLLRYEPYEDRKQRVTDYLDRGATRFEPQCWQKHHDAGEEVPLDWEHTLQAIYKIRCNLFHGLKSAHSEMDKRIVSAAFLTLLHFINEAKYLDIIP